LEEIKKLSADSEKNQVEVKVEEKQDFLKLALTSALACFFADGWKLIFNRRLHNERCIGRI